MKAEQIFREKQTLDGYIREMVVWRLHKPVSGCRHQFKYRFLEGVELPYLFRSLDATFADFLADIAKVMEKERTRE